MKTTIDLSVIDQMFSAILAANENDATIDALRPQVEQAVKELPHVHRHHRVQRLPDPRATPQVLHLASQHPDPGRRP